MLDLFMKNKTPEYEYKEGDLFKELSVNGRTFKIYYGYYEECERSNPLIEPMPIYPNFIQNPEYTDDGNPYVTKTQDACIHYKGRITKFRECAECAFFAHGEDFIGVCTYPDNKCQSTEKKETEQND